MPRMASMSPPAHRLLIGNDRQRLHRRARVARRLLRRETLEVRLNLGPRLETPPACHLRQLDTAIGPRRSQILEELADEVGLERRIEQLR